MGVYEWVGSYEWNGRLLTLVLPGDHSGLYTNVQGVVGSIIRTRLVLTVVDGRYPFDSLLPTHTLGLSWDTLL